MTRTDRINWPWRTPATTIVFVSCVVAAVLTTHASAAEKPCQTIQKACADAGFFKNGMREGNGLLGDCVEPIMQGASQPNKASRPLPQIDPQLIAACRATDPSFGNPQGTRSDADVAPSQLVVPAPLLGPRAPNGISTVNPIDAHRVGQLFDTSNPTLNAYTNPNTSGVTFRTSWADLEPEEGKFDFNKIDQVFDNAEKNGKWVELILIPGFGTPSWAMQGVLSGTFPIPYGPGNGMSLPLPAPWDQTYLSRWFTFLKAVEDRYAGRTSFRKIAAAGPTSVSAEMALPESRNDIAQWKKMGYTSQKYIDAWKQTFSRYSSMFPRQYFSLALHPALPIPDSSQKTYVREQIISLGLRYPRQFALQADGLNSNGADEKYGYRAIIDHNGQVVTGFMMSTSATLRSQKMGTSSNPVSDLHISIDTGLVPNSQNQTIKYLEIYEPDIVNPSMQEVLREAREKLLEIPSP